MSDLTLIQFDKDYSKLIESIRTQATPFPRDSIEKRLARTARARSDEMFFAAIYFPHYIELADGYQDIWKDPDAKIDWVKAGFATYHPTFFDLCKLRNQFNLLAGHRESAKDTLIGKIDVLYKLFCEICWLIEIVAYSDAKAETKVMPIRAEIENNIRLKNDFGDIKGLVKWEQGEFITRDGRKVRSSGIDVPMRGEENAGHRVDWLMLNDIDDPTKSFNSGICTRDTMSIKQDKLEAVNSKCWGGIYLFNYISKQSIGHELMTGKNTAHFGKHIFRSLIANEKKTVEDIAIARMCREKGFDDNLKSAWEHRHPTLKLLQKKKQDSDTFDPEWMMHPRDNGSKIFKDADFKFYFRKDINLAKCICYTMVDPSVKDSGDYKPVITAAVPMESETLQILIWDAWIRQGTVDAMLEETFRQHKEYQSKIVGVEMIGFAALLQREYQRMMKKKGYALPLHQIESVTNKDARIESLAPLVKQGIILFDKNQDDQDLLMRQFKGFPDKTQVSNGGIGDDGPDCTQQLVKLIEDFPAGLHFDYESVEKRQVMFDEGAY
jgi:predicted phage terminase large subunit-like protein